LLCATRCARSSQRKKYASALACSWLAIAHGTRGYYKKSSSEYSTSDHEHWSAVVRSLVEFDWSQLPQGPNPLFGLESMPVLLIQVCDELLASRSVGATAEEGKIAEMEALYERDVVSIDLDQSLMTTLGVALTGQRVFLVRRRRSSEKSPVQRQHLDPERFNINFHVIPELPDRNQAHRLVDVKSASNGLVLGCQNVAKRETRTLKVYVAEFECTPEFESRMVTEPGARTAWIAIDIKNAGQMRDAVIQHLIRARDAAADVVVFPELMFPKSLRMAVSEWLATKTAKATPATPLLG
jgi:hypothetical protein